MQGVAEQPALLLDVFNAVLALIDFIFNQKPVLLYALD